MNAATLLRIVRDLITLLETEGILTATGFDDTKLDTIAEDAAFALKVTAILKRYGVHTPDNLDRVLQLLPLLAGFLK